MRRTANKDGSVTEEIFGQATRTTTRKDGTVTVENFGQVIQNTTAGKNRALAEDNFGQGTRQITVRPRPLRRSLSVISPPKAELIGCFSRRGGRGKAPNRISARAPERPFAKMIPSPKKTSVRVPERLLVNIGPLPKRITARVVTERLLYRLYVRDHSGGHPSFFHQKLN